MNRVSPSRRSLAVAVAFALVATGCGASSSPGTVPQAITVSPGTASILVGGEVTFQAMVTGATASVTWSVVEGPVGGSISPEGRYVGPGGPGTFHVRATSTAHPAASADAVVTVTPYARAMVRVADGSSARDHHSATLLEDGSVLVVGGAGFTGALAVADRFFPTSRTFTVAGTLGTPRIAHGAAPIPGGRVLVAGGWDPGAPGTAFDPVLRSSEIWDPARSAFSPGPELVFPRRHATFTVLPDGRLLVAGGIQLRGTGFGSSPNTETYDPVANAFVEGPRMVAANGRWLHTATLLADGRVLLVGGRENNCTATCPVVSLGSAEVYDPSTATFTATGSLGTSRFGHSATRLPDGRVLVLGGTTSEDLGIPTDQVTAAEAWDPATGQFSPAGRTLEGRSHAALADLNDGTLLLVGGFNSNGSPVASVEIFDPRSGTSTLGPEGSDWRHRATATKLQTGEVLVVGGNNSGGPVLPVDLFR